MSRYARRKDGNHDEVKGVLCSVAQVLDVHCFPDIGCDLIVYFRRQAWHVEIKDGSLPPSRRQLTDNERESMARCAASGVPYVVARDTGEAACAIGAAACGAVDCGCGTVEGPGRYRARREILSR